VVTGYGHDSGHPVRRCPNCRSEMVCFHVASGLEACGGAGSATAVPEGLSADEAGSLTALRGESGKRWVIMVVPYGFLAVICDAGSYALVRLHAKTLAGLAVCIRHAESAQ
jgi:ribosomal protein S27E